MTIGLLFENFTDDVEQYADCVSYTNPGSEKKFPTPRMKSIYLRESYPRFVVLKAAVNHAHYPHEDYPVAGRRGTIGGHYSKVLPLEKTGERGEILRYPDDTKGEVQSKLRQFWNASEPEENGVKTLVRMPSQQTSTATAHGNSVAPAPVASNSTPDVKDDATNTPPDPETEDVVRANLRATPELPENTAPEQVSQESGQAAKVKRHIARRKRVLAPDKKRFASWHE
jgi:hypothetical protein